MSESGSGSSDSHSMDPGDGSSDDGSEIIDVVTVEEDFDTLPVVVSGSYRESKEVIASDDDGDGGGSLVSNGNLNVDSGSDAETEEEEDQLEEPIEDQDADASADEDEVGEEEEVADEVDEQEVADDVMDEQEVVVDEMDEPKEVVDEMDEPEEVADQVDVPEVAAVEENVPSEVSELEDYEMDIAEENSGRNRANSDAEEVDEDEDEDFRLEDEDYDLLEENLGVKLRRHRFKRLRRVADSDSEDESHEKVSPEARQRRAESVMRSDVESNDDSGSEDAFIVDDVGQPVSSRITAAPEYSDANIQEAREVFGGNFDYGDIPASDPSEGDEEEEDEITDSEEDQSVIQSSVGHRHQRKSAKRVNLAELYDPAILENIGVSDEAQKIGATDIPERYQLRRYALTETGPELNGEVIWIYRKAFAGAVAEPREGTDDLSNVGCLPGFPASTVVKDEWDEDDGAESSFTQIPDTPTAPTTLRNRLLTKIKKIIKLIRDEKFEVPYIYFYQKDFVKPEFEIYDLWKIYNLDQEYCRLYERKHRFLDLFANMQSYQEALGDDYLERNDVRLITQEDLELIQDSKELEELQDIQAMFLLYYSDDVPKMKEMQARKKQELQSLEREGEDVVDEHSIAVRPSSSGGTYRTCNRHGIGKMLPLIGLTAEEFGENLESSYATNLVHQTEVDFDEVLQIFTSDRFRENGMVADGAKYMMATNLSRDVRVRRVVRSVFHSKAKLSVNPTRKGLSEIDENHPIFTLMFLKGKPVVEVDAIDFLELCDAEKSGLITMSIGDYIPDRAGSGISLIEEAKSYFRSESDEPVTEKWEAFRETIVESAFEKMLYPEFRKEVRYKLLQKGRELIVQRCSDRVYNYIKDAPFTVQYEKDDDEETWKTSNGIRVMGVAYDDDTPVVCVVLDRKGEVMKSAVVSNLFTRNVHRMTDTMAESRDSDREKLRILIEETKPHVVVIGGESRGAVNISDEIREIIYSFPEWEMNFRLIPVHIIENNISKIYSRTSTALTEFPDTVEYFRQAVSLGRFLQDPLLETAQLCNREDDISCLHLYRYQRHISKEELMRGIELEFINRACETGVDLNDAADHKHRSHSLQFVAGFGYFKSQALLRKIRHIGRKVENRAELLDTYGVGSLVFKNAAGFIRIKENIPEDAEIDPRDQTRIHPDYYKHALSVCRAALSDEEQCVDYSDMDLLVQAMTDPICQENLKILDLDEYLERLRSDGYGDLKYLFGDIVTELLCPYVELRKPFHIPAQEELFYILTKETFESMREAKLLTAYMNDARWRMPSESMADVLPLKDTTTGVFSCRFCAADFRVLNDVWAHYDHGDCPGELSAIHIRFGNGITGIIRIENLSDEPVRPGELLKFVALRLPIQVRVLRIDLNKFFVECTSKTSDLQNVDFMPRKDPYYDEEAERERTKKEALKPVRQPLGGFVRRNVTHPSFKNISYQEAEAILKDMDQGDCIFRPSTKGFDQLSLTWNVVPGIFQHMNITEKQKPSEFELGTKLVIAEREFEDFDEIMARFVNPQAAYAREIITHKYYKEEDYEDPAGAAEYLTNEREANPDKNHYCLTASRKAPGRFLLSFLVQENMYQEVLSIFSEGVFFRGEYFQSVEECLDHWKKGFQNKGKDKEQPNQEPNEEEQESLSV